MLTPNVQLDSKNILVTGAAGFIGANLVMELLARSYSKLHNIPSTGLRFFTFYGPAGRPDMAYFGFTNKLREGNF